MISGNDRRVSLGVRATALVAALLAVPATANAQCLSATRCLCWETAAVYEGHVTAVAEGSATVAIDAVHGEVDSDAGAPAEVTLTRFNGLEVGDRLLVFPSPSGDPSFTPIQPDETIQCSNLSIPLEDATQIALDPECKQTLESRGFVEPPCHDVHFGCSSSGGSSSLVAFGLLLLFLYSRRIFSGRASAP